MGGKGRTPEQTGKEPVSFADSRPLRLFPTLIWRAELADEDRQRVNAALLEVLGEIRAALPPLGHGEAWQSKQDFHTLKPLAGFVACVEAAAAEDLGYLKIGHGRLDVTACWFNVLAPGRSHRAHSHPNNFLSGVYYIKTQAGADTVNFHDPRSQTGILRPPVTALTADNTDQVVVQVAPGTLLLFPAWLDHSVDENRSEEERISVSFNMMFPAASETISKPMW